MLALLAIGAGVLGVSRAAAGPPPPVTNCDYVTAGAVSPDTSGDNLTHDAIPNVTTITAGKGTWTAGCVLWSYDFYNGATLDHSGASNTYTPGSSDYGATITVTVWGCDVNDNCVPVNDTGQTTVLGASKFYDDFSGTLSKWTQISKVSSTEVNFASSGHAAINSGELGITATCSASCTSPQNWTSAHLQSNSSAAYSGSRYIQVRAEVPCGGGVWGAPAWEWTQHSGGGGTPPNFENDVVEQLGSSTYGTPGHTSTDWYHTTLHNDPDSNPGDDVQWPIEKNAGTALCGVWHTYGAEVLSNEVNFFMDGTLETMITAADIGLSGTNLATAFSEDLNIDLSLAYPGTTISSTLTSPLDMYVNWVYVKALS